LIDFDSSIPDFKFLNFELMANKRKKRTRTSKGALDSLNKVIEPVQLMNTNVKGSFTNITGQSNRKTKRSKKNAWKKDKRSDVITLNTNPWGKNSKIIKAHMNAVSYKTSSKSSKNSSISSSINNSNTMSPSYSHKQINNNNGNVSSFNIITNNDMANNDDNDDSDDDDDDEYDDDEDIYDDERKINVNNSNNNNNNSEITDINKIKEESEVLKCRFRSQMLCGNVIEHLHDRYSEEIQIHYEKFYRQYSLQLLLTSSTLKKIALNDFIFNIHQSIDYIIQECKHENKNDLKECIIIGDGSNIPEILNLFSQYFLISTNMESTYPIIARGCAVSAAVDNEIMDSPLALQVLPRTIKMEEPSLNGCLTTVIQSQLGCPCKRTVTRFTFKDNQTSYKVKFFEGESSNINKCNLIGTYNIYGIKPRLKLQTKLIICMHVDRNCILVVSAEDATNSPPINLNVQKIL